MGAALCDIGAIEYCPPPVTVAVGITVAGADVVLSWVSDAGNSDGYVIVRDTDPLFGSSIPIASLPAGSTGYTDTDAADTGKPNYYYGIAGVNLCQDISDPVKKGKFSFTIVPGS